jgi:hypothetical protein
LNPAVVQAQTGSGSFHQQSLGQTRIALQKSVTSRKDGHQQLFDSRILAYNDFIYLAPEPLEDLRCPAVDFLLILRHYFLLCSFSGGGFQVVIAFPYCFFSIKWQGIQEGLDLPLPVALPGNR